MRRTALGALGRGLRPSFARPCGNSLFLRVNPLEIDAGAKAMTDAYKRWFEMKLVGEGHNEKGSVQVIMTGSGTLTEMKIDPALKGDVESIQTLTLNAMHDARTKMQNEVMSFLDSKTKEFEELTGTKIGSPEKERD